MSSPAATSPAAEAAKKTEANQLKTGEGKVDKVINKGGSSQAFQAASSTKANGDRVENGGGSKWKGKGKKRSPSGDQMKNQGQRAGKKARRTNEANKNEGANNHRGSLGHHGRIPDRSSATTGSFKSYYVRRGGVHDGGGDDSDKHKQRVDDTRLPVLQKFIEALPFRPNILDIGCNDGTLTLQVAELAHVKQVVGLDLDKELVKRARGALRQLVFNKVDEDNRKRKENTANKPISTSTTNSSKEQKDETGGNTVKQNDDSIAKLKPSTDFGKVAQSSLKQHNPTDVEKTTPTQSDTNVVAKNVKTEIANGATGHPEKESIKTDSSIAMTDEELKQTSNSSSGFATERNTVEHVAQKQTVSSSTPSPSTSSASVAQSPATPTQLTTKHQQQGQGLASCTFPYNVTFHLEDFVSASASKPASTSAPASVSVSASASQPNSQLQSEWHHRNKYDIVFCLSVTKWVHLKHGDAGLERLFRRIYACVKPGGWLILEPQMTRSYKQARRKGLAPKDFDLGRCRLKPNLFRQFLLQSVGFARVSVLRDVQKGQEYNRPIFAFHKGSHGHLSSPSGPNTTTSRKNNSDVNGNANENINDKINTTSCDGGVAATPTLATQVNSLAAKTECE